jgi:hypothetical protein
MIKNEVDEFRKNFFDKLIKEEKEKEKAIIMAQKSCFHNYNLMGIINANGYQQRTCSKCGHSAEKSVRVWEGTKNGNCTIA